MEKDNEISQIVEKRMKARLVYLWNQVFTPEMEDFLNALPDEDKERLMKGFSLIIEKEFFKRLKCQEN